MIGRGIIGLVLLSALVGCGGSEESGGTSPSTSTEPSSSASVPTATPSNPTPSATTPSATRPSSVPSSTAPSAGASVPVAKDGQNYKACNDGSCEVLIRGKATLNITGDKSTVTVVDGTLKITDANGYVSISGGGYSSWGDSGGPLHTAALKYAKGDTAILVLTTRK